MPQVLRCVILEWGWGFLVGSLFVIIVIALLLGLIAWFVLHRWQQSRQNPEPAILSSGEARFEGSEALVSALIVLVVFLAPIIGIGWFVYNKFEEYETKYSVAVDSLTVQVTLEELGERYKGDTQATITITDPAKKFPITGSYEGVCVADFFESICRQYGSKISCDTSLMRRTLDVDLKR